jgi:hypothetical protein
VGTFSAYRDEVIGALCCVFVRRFTRVHLGATRCQNRASHSHWQTCFHVHGDYPVLHRRWNSGGALSLALVATTLRDPDGGHAHHRWSIYYPLTWSPPFVRASAPQSANADAGRRHAVRFTC